MLTRAKAQLAEWTNHFTSLGYNVIEFPCLEFEEIKNDSLNLPGEFISQYDIVSFSSPNGVKFFFNQIGKNFAVENNFPLTACVGNKTKATLLKYGVNCSVYPEVQNGVHLAEELINAGINGKKLLIPTSEIARDELPGLLTEAGATVDVIHVYRPVLPHISDEELRELKTLKNGIIVFTSPSTFNNFCTLTGSNHKNILYNNHIASIGDTTASAIEAGGYKCEVVSVKSSLEDLSESIKKFLNQNPEQFWKI